MGLSNISNEALKTLVENTTNDTLLLDVRTWEEYAQLGHLKGSVLIPIQEIVARIGELDPERSTVVICQHGIRSAEVAHYLHHIGFKDVMNYEPGMAAWDGPVEMAQMAGQPNEGQD